MKKVLIKTIILSILVLLIPFILTMLVTQNEETSSLATMEVTIYYESNGMNDKLSLDDYLLGVVAANMPAGYEMEALKAQAVIARTYALYNIALLTKENPNKTSFTTSELGLSYISLDSLEQYWGTDEYHNYFTKLENAVFGTKGEVIIFDDKLILPVFFDTGSGFTRNASEAWGVDVPYLISVPSKQDVTSTSYLKIKEYKVSEIISLINSYYTDVNLEEDKFFKEVSVSERDSVGYATKVELGKKSVSGEEFAKVLGLSSNHFYIEDYEGKVRIICNGAGHGIGMSQYGANAMADGGSKYDEILSYYYTNVSIISLTDKD